MGDPGDEMWAALDDVEAAVRALRVLLRDDPHGPGMDGAVDDLRVAARAADDAGVELVSRRIRAKVRAERPDLWVSR